MTQANEIIAQQNFNALSDSGTRTLDSVASGSPLTNASAFSQDGEGIDFQTFWFDTRGVTMGPVTAENDSSDFIGVNSFAGNNSPDVSADAIPVASGFEHNFEFNDGDGRLDLVFDAVNVSGFSNRQLSIKYWISTDSFEDEDALSMSLSDGSTSVEVFSVQGDALEGQSIGDAGDAAEWQTLTVDLDDLIASNALGESLILTVSADHDAGGENMFVDDIVFESITDGDGSGGDDGGSDDPIITAELGACAATDNLGFQFISAVQGSDGASVLVTEQVVIEGVVTASRNNGFFLQEEVADEDSDATTSEGIFVEYDGDLPNINSTIRLLGTVEEFFNLTQITDVTDMMDCSTDTTPPVTTVSLSFPLADGESLEQYEGMMVSVTDLTVFDTGTLWRFGELGLSTEIKRNPTDLFVPLSAEYEQQILDNQANIIYVEDNTSTVFPDSLSFFTGFSYANPITIGDSVSTSGPLNFAFGLFRINPLEQISLVNSREATPDLTAGNLTIAAFNVLNYFNGEDDGNGGVTFDFDANRGAESEEEFTLQQARIVEAIVGIDADVLGLVEIENDGFGDDSAIQSLITAVNAQLADDSQYSFIATSDGSLVGSDAIAVGIMYRDSVVTPSGDAVIIDMPSQLQADDTSLVQMRDSLLQSFTHVESEEPFAVVVNHFKSKGSGCFEDDNSPSQLDEIQGSCNALRVSASVALGDALAAADLPERVMILGDLNAYSAEDPLAVLTDYDPAERGYTITTSVRTMLNDVMIDNGEAVEVIDTYGYESVAQAFEPDGFSFWFFTDTEAGSLDHILATSSFMDDVVDATHWNINSVEAFQLQYDQALAFYPDDEGFAFTDVGPFRSSDHDPFIVSVNLQAAIVDNGSDDDDGVDEPDQDTSSGGGALGTSLLALGLGLITLRRRFK